MSKTGYVEIASRRGEGRGNQLMSKTGYVEIASRLVTVARFCFRNLWLFWLQQEFTPLRIKLEYDSSLDLLANREKTLIQNKVIPSSIEFWQKTLSARQPVKKILLDRHCITPQVVIDFDESILN
jgi:hypothetical protein